jgi:hypothetical protein
MSDSIFKAHYILASALSDEIPSYKLYDGSPISTNHTLSSRNVEHFIETRSFKILLNCEKSFGDEDAEICGKVSEALKRVATRLERVIYLSNVVTIKCEYLSFCKDNALKLGKPCEYAQTTLGHAVPKGWHQFNEDAALAFGLDPNYTYPSSLARQYAGKSRQFDKFKYGIK